MPAGTTPVRRDRLALAGVLVWATLSLGWLVLAMAGLRHLWIASVSGWAALTALWLLLRGGRVGGVPFRTCALAVLTVGAAARAAVLVCHGPALSEDVYRYVFDGRNLAAGINPYLVRPQERLEPGADRWPGESRTAARINNPELTTIYLPVSQYVFAAAGAVLPASWSDPDSAARLFRAVFVAFDLGLISLLLAALHRSGRPAWWAALYAWHPLPVMEIAGSGHQESLGIFLMIAALLAVSTTGRTWLWTTLLALSALVKPVSIPVAAFVLRGRRWQDWAGSALLGLVVCAAAAAPLLLVGGGEPAGNLMETAERFRLKWAHFGGAYEPLLRVIEQVSPSWTNDQQEILARRTCVLAVTAVIAGTWWRRRHRPDLWTEARIMLSAMVLLSPAAHPWYLLWALALVPMGMGPATWVASLTISWGYAARSHAVSPWLLLAAWAPVYAALAADLALRARRSSTPALR